PPPPRPPPLPYTTLFRSPAAVRGGVPATGPGFPVERADPSPQDLQLSGSVKGYVTQARAVCVQLAPPPEAEFVAQLLLELKPGRSEEHTSELQSLAYLVC